MLSGTTAHNSSSASGSSQWFSSGAWQYTRRQRHSHESVAFYFSCAVNRLPRCANAPRVCTARFVYSQDIHIHVLACVMTNEILHNTPMSMFSSSAISRHLARTPESRGTASGLQDLLDSLARPGLQSAMSAYSIALRKNSRMATGLPASAAVVRRRSPAVRLRPHSSGNRSPSTSISGIASALP